MIPHLLCGTIPSHLEVVQLLLEEEPSHRRGQVLGESLGGAVGAVGSAESVVDIQVSIGRELLGELGV
eukprot:38297-Eustigmatos_ZCMA.PRE.1